MGVAFGTQFSVQKPMGCNSLYRTSKTTTGFLCDTIYEPRPDISF